MVGSNRIVVIAEKHKERKQTQRQKKVFTLYFQRFCDSSKELDIQKQSLEPPHSEHFVVIWVVI